MSNVFENKPLLTELMKGEEGKLTSLVDDIKAVSWYFEDNPNKVAGGYIKVTMHCYFNVYKDIKTVEEYFHIFLRSARSSKYKYVGVKSFVYVYWKFIGNNTGIAKEILNLIENNGNDGSYMVIK